MDPIQLPEDLTSLSDDQLGALRSTDIPAYAAHLRAQVAEHREAGTALPAELTAAIATLTSQTEALTAETNRRVEAAADTSQAFDLAESALAALTAEGEGEGEGESTEDLTVDGGDDGGETAPPAEPAPVQDGPAASLSAEAIAAIAAQSAAAAAQAVLAAQPPPAPAPASTQGSLATLQVPAGVAPAPPGPGGAGDYMRTTAYALGQGIEAGQALPDRLAVAKAMNETLNRFQRSAPAAGVREFVPIATAAWDRPQTVTAEHEQSLLPMALAVAEGTEALVASGQCCTPLSPMYEFCRLAVPQSPVENALPTVGAPRGGIRHLVTPDWRQAFAAVDEQCCGDNDDPENPVLKACSRVECPELEDTTVCAISWCAEFDNLQSRTFPELIDNYMEDLAVAYARRKEIFYLDQIHNVSTDVTGRDTGYGATLQFFYNLTLGADGYRKRNRMPDSAVLNSLIPSWVMGVIKADYMFQAVREGNPNPVLSDGQLSSWFTAAGVRPTWYVDSATGQDMAFDDVQAAVFLNEWPDEALTYLFSPGTFVRLDGGTLDVGLVRDSTLTRRNDFQMFYEEWTAVAQLCPESIALTIPLCANGASPELAPLYECFIGS